MWILYIIVGHMSSINSNSGFAKIMDKTYEMRY